MQASQQSGDALWETDTAAQYLGKSTQWVRENRIRLAIPAYRLGRQLRFRKADLDRWIEGQAE